VTTADRRRARIEKATEDDEQEEEDDEQEEEEDEQEEEIEAQQARSTRTKATDSLKKTRSVCMCIHHVYEYLCDEEKGTY
jgi:hypothetical protein